MKTILFIMLLAFMSCQKTYITVVDINDGKFMTIRDSQHVTFIGDTLITVEATQEYRGHALYGKYVGQVPEGTSMRKFRKVVRTK